MRDCVSKLTLIDDQWYVAFGNYKWHKLHSAQRLRKKDEGRHIRVDWEGLERIGRKCYFNSFIEEPADFETTKIEYKKILVNCFDNLTSDQQKELGEKILRMLRHNELKVMG